MSAADILVVGEAIGDFIPRDTEGRHYEAVLGGSGFNAALALARFGARPAYAGALSTDALGRRFRDAQGRLNQAVAAAVPRVVFVAAGLPIELKAPRAATEEP